MTIIRCFVAILSICGISASALAQFTADGKVRYDDYWMEAYEMREKLVLDKQHFVIDFEKAYLIHYVYPTLYYCIQFRLFSEDGKINASNLFKWEMDATNPWQKNSRKQSAITDIPHDDKPKVYTINFWSTPFVWLGPSLGYE